MKRTDLVPSMVSYSVGDSQSFWQEESWVKWKKIILTGSSAACAAVAIAAKVENFHGWERNAVGSALLSLAAGGAFQNAVQTALPHQFSNLEKSFVADYALPIFLIASQVYLNLPNPSATVKDAIFSCLTAQGGMCLAAFIHSLVTRRLSEQDEATPLSASKDSHHLKLVFLNSSRERLVWSLAKGCLGVASIAVGASVHQAILLRDFGVILCGDAVGQLGSELYLRAIKPIFVDYCRAISAPSIVDEDDITTPQSLTVYKTLTKIFLATAHVLPGVLIVFAGAASQAKIPYIYSAVGNGLTGFFAGAKAHLERARFTEVPAKELVELQRYPQKEPPLETLFRIFKWSVAIMGVGGFIGLGIAGLNANNGQFQYISPYIRSALAVFAGFLYGSYAVAEYAKRQFKIREPISRIKSTLYFYTHYSLGVPMIALYILEKMQINDQALSQDATLAGVLGCIAYASLGAGIGLEANSRGDFPHPRVFSSLAATLIGNFIASLITKQI